MNHSSVDYDKLQEPEEAIAEQLQPQVHLWWIRSGVPGESRRWPDRDSEPRVFMTWNLAWNSEWQVATKYCGDFMTARSTVAALIIKVINVWAQGLRQWPGLWSLCHIHIKGFNTVPHLPLLDKFLLRWLHNYLLHKSQYVGIELTSGSFRCSTRIRTWTNRR